jgi:cyclic-di-AMP phosphodiesterase PgpH
MLNLTSKTVDISFKKGISADTWSLAVILISLTVLSTLILSPKLIIVQTPYQLGDIAEKDIKAPADLLIEDTEATALKRRQVRNEVLTVYDYDTKLLDSLTRQINDAFSLARNIIKTPVAGETAGDMRVGIRETKPQFEKALGIPVDNGAYGILVNQGFSQKISDLLISILSQILNNGVVANKELLIQENPQGIVLKTIDADSERIVQNLRQFYSPDQAKTMVRVIGEPILKGVDYNLVNLIVDFTQRLIQPNIAQNRGETEKRKKEAENQVQPILYKIKKGEMILREGDRVSQSHIMKLKTLQEQSGKQQVFEKSIGTAMIIFSLLIITYFIHLKYQSDILYYRNKHLIFIGSILIILLLILKLSVSLANNLTPDAPVNISPESVFYAIPIPAGAMTICQFLGFKIAFPFAIVLALISGMLFEASFEFSLFFILNSIVGAFWVQDCKDHKGFIKAGVRLGLLNMALAAVVSIYMVDFSGFKLLWDLTFAFSGGIIAGIITAGIAPLMEMAFGYTTKSSLLELANLDQPILRRLMLEAPGTYHHSFIVGSLAEAAASEIGANPLIAKVSGYYHDIGKLKNPLYFIENQRDGKNIHNKLAPSMSCLILTSHVKNGMEIAREKKLGQQITEAITQHHGTTLISFFYEKAKKLQKDQVVNIDDFRYPGPKPQTRETALVMLADVVEAAARTLEQPTPSRIQGLVQQLINKLFSDHQLDECPLTLKDLNNIAKSFNKILNGIYHHRIEYPDAQPPAEKKEKNGHTDRQPATTETTDAETDTEDSPSTLKRLGQS